MQTYIRTYRTYVNTQRWFSTQHRSICRLVNKPVLHSVESLVLSRLDYGITTVDIIPYYPVQRFQYAMIVVIG